MKRKLKSASFSLLTFKAEEDLKLERHNDAPRVHEDMQSFGRIPGLRHRGHGDVYLSRIPNGYLS